MNQSNYHHHHHHDCLFCNIEIILIPDLDEDGGVGTDKSKTLHML